MDKEKRCKGSLTSPYMQDFKRIEINLNCSVMKYILHTENVQLYK